MSSTSRVTVSQTYECFYRDDSDQSGTILWRDDDGNNGNTCLSLADLWINQEAPKRLDSYECRKEFLYSGVGYNRSTGGSKDGMTESITFNNIRTRLAGVSVTCAGTRKSLCDEPVRSTGSRTKK